MDPRYPRESRYKDIFYMSISLSLSRERERDMACRAISINLSLYGIRVGVCTINLISRETAPTYV